MTLKDAMKNDVSVFLNTDEHAEEIMYALKESATQKTINAIINEDQIGDVEDRGTWDETILTVVISRDATTGIENPARGDRITRNGTVYRVAGVNIQDQAMAQLACKKYDKKTEHMDGRRRQT